LKNKLLITISDINGSKSYKINKVFKKFFSFIIVAGLLLFILTMLFINTLNAQIGDLHNQIDKLSNKEKELLTQAKIYSLNLKEKVNDIKNLSIKLDKIENIIGLKPSKYISETTRVDFAKMTIIDRINALQIIPNGAPIKNYEITSKYGFRIHPVSKKRKLHKGVDFRAKINTPIYATADGVVKFVQNRNIGSFGRIVVISHNYGFETLFAHLNKVNVKVGDVIYKGKLIAKSGNSGRSSGPHLHYEIKYGVKNLNPIHLIKWNFKNYENVFNLEKKVKWNDIFNQIAKHERAIKKQI